MFQCQCLVPVIDMHRRVNNRGSKEPGFTGMLVIENSFVELRNGVCWCTNVSVGPRWNTMSKQLS